MEKKRYKMYKAGKNWMVAAIAFGTVATTLGMGAVANADAKPATPANTTNTTVVTPAKDANANKDVKADTNKSDVQTPAKADNAQANKNTDVKADNTNVTPTKDANANKDVKADANKSDVQTPAKDANKDTKADNQSTNVTPAKANNDANKSTDTKSDAQTPAKDNAQANKANDTKSDANKDTKAAPIDSQNLSDFGKAYNNAVKQDDKGQANTVNTVNNAIANPQSVTHKTDDPVVNNTNVLTGLGFAENDVKATVSGDDAATHAFFDKVATLSPADQTKARAAYNVLATDYMKTHKSGVYVTANHNGFEYKNSNLTDNQQIAYNKGDVFKITGIVRAGSKVRLQLPDGNYISAYHADLNNDYTNANALNDMTNNVKTIKVHAKKHAAKKHVRKNAKKHVVKRHRVRKGSFKRRAVKKHAIKRHAVKKHVRKARAARKYYKRTPKGKKHLVFIKRNILLHNNKHRMTAKRAKGSRVPRGAKLQFKKIVRHGRAYRIMLSRHAYVTANKAFVRLMK